MYFAWLGMYTKWLVAPAVLGIITFFLSNRGEVTRDWCIFFFNIFNIVWATLFLEAWKRKSAELAYKWGTMDMPSDALKEPRPLFRVGCLQCIVHSRESLFSSNVFKARLPTSPGAFYPFAICTSFFVSPLFSFLNHIISFSIS